jgi:hypothetical protein
MLSFREQVVIGPGERILELREPIVCVDRNIAGFVEHARFSSQAVFAAFSLYRTLYSFGIEQKGRDEMPPIRWSLSGSENHSGSRLLF